MSTGTATSIVSIISATAAAVALVIHAYAYYRSGGKAQ